MKPQYQHQVMTSFFLWFDNYLLQKGEAYSNKTGVLYSNNDTRLPSTYSRFASPYKQWVSDSSITGSTNPIIPTGFNLGAGMKTRSEGGYSIDFENGSIINLDNGTNTYTTVTGAFAVKDFNVYLTNETEEDLILESKFKKNSRYTNGEPTTGVEPYDQMTPAIFINNETVSNVPFAFGGEDETRVSIKAVVLAENLYQLDGVLSIFADSRHKNITLIPFTGHPVSEFGDIKPSTEGNGGTNNLFNYTGMVHAYKANEEPLYIENVTVSKFSDRAKEQTIGDLKIGFIDFDVYQRRFPRADTPTSPSVSVNSTNVFNLFIQERTNLDAIGASNIFLTGEIPAGSNFSGPGNDSNGPFDARYSSATLSPSTELIRAGVTGITFATNERIVLTPLGSSIRRTGMSYEGSFTVLTGTNLAVSGNGTDFDLPFRSFQVRAVDNSSQDNYIDTTITGVKIQSQIRAFGSGDSQFIFDNGSKIVDITDFTHTVKINNSDND